MKRFILGAALFGITIAGSAALTSITITGEWSKAYVYDVTTPAGHQCTVALHDDSRGGIALHCWK